MLAQDALKTRRSARSFQAKPLSRKVIEELLECARFAPTARNIQPWEFVVVTDQPMLAKLGNMAQNGFFIADAPCCIAVFCSDTKYYLEDGAAATVNILTAAAGLGLCGCWVAGDKKEYAEEVKVLVGAPEGFKLVSLIPVGYPGASAGSPVKRPLQEMVHWERW